MMASNVVRVRHLVVVLAVLAVPAASEQPPVVPSHAPQPTPTVTNPGVGTP